MSPARTNEQWLADLSSTGNTREDALAELRRVILKGLPYALSNWLSPGDPAFGPFMEEVAQETLLRVLDRLETFEGRSRFTTWVHKIAVRLALTELRRKRWQEVSLDKLVAGAPGEGLARILASPDASPDVRAEQADMLDRIERIMEEELTEKQRTALVAARVRGMPIEEVARRMGTNRNALYKLLHDARLRLKRRLASEGLTPEDVLAAFERR